MLFPNKRRTDMDPKRYSESDFEYLNRSARPETGRVRAVFDDWFSRYPEEEKPEFLSRFQSGNDIQLTSSAFELYLHEILLKLSYTIKVHPENPSGKLSRPDFLVADRSGYQFFVEATLATDISEKDRAAESRRNVVYDSLNRLDSPNFFLGMSIRNATERPPSGRLLRKELSRWLSQLDPDIVASRLKEDGFRDLPHHRYHRDGWEIEFTSIPKSRSKRGHPGIRPIGALFPGAKWLSTWESIRDAVASKGSHYGDLEAPLIVAVNVGRFHLDRIDEMQALFGQETFKFPIDDLSQGPQMERAPNGLWVGIKGVQYRRVSAVLITPDVRPWTISSRNGCLYHNPWGNHSVIGALCTLPQAILKNQVMQWQEGTHPREILGIHEGWPEVGIAAEEPIS